MVTTLLDTETLNGAGQATSQPILLPVGVYDITVQYLGDNNFDGTTSLALSETINPALIITPTALPPITRARPTTILSPLAMAPPRIRALPSPTSTGAPPA